MNTKNRSELTHNTDKKTHQSPNYPLRRKVAAGLLAIGLLGAAKFSGEIIGATHDRYFGTDVPNAEDVKQNPDMYIKYKIQPGDSLSRLAHEDTKANHDDRNNINNYRDQILDKNPDFNGILQPDMTIYRPAPDEDTKQEQAKQE